jgi:hypothetical protein
MSEEDEIVMVIDKPHFVVRLRTSLLEVDLKEGARKKLEDVIEAHPHLRESIGLLFQTIIPLDVPLKDIQKAMVDKKGHVKIVIPRRRDISIPLEPDESQRLVDKLNEMIPVEKARDAEEDLESEEEEIDAGAERAEMKDDAREETMGRI